MITLSFYKADNFVARLQRKGVNVRWEGWNMVFFSPDKRARYNNTAARRVGDEWGFETTVSPNAAGMWLVPNRLVRGANG